MIKTTHTTHGQGGSANIVTDSTVRTDGACRLYAPSTTQVLTSDNELSIILNAGWTTASTSLYLGRVTTILQATTTAVAAPAHAGATPPSATSSR
jgi:hypothetical protein